MGQHSTPNPAARAELTGDPREAARRNALSSIEVLLNLLRELDRSVGHADIPWLVLDLEEAQAAIAALDPEDAVAPTRIAVLSTALKGQVHGLLGQITEMGERHEQALAAAGRRSDQIRRWFRITAAAAAAAEDFGRLADPRRWGAQPA